MRWNGLPYEDTADKSAPALRVLSSTRADLGDRLVVGLRTLTPPTGVRQNRRARFWTREARPQGERQGWRESNPLAVTSDPEDIFLAAEIGRGERI